MFHLNILYYIINKYIDIDIDIDILIEDKHQVEQYNMFWLHLSHVTLFMPVLVYMIQSCS